MSTKQREPRYAVIATDLIDAIETGEYGLGDPLPSEAQLCAEFQASRFTVREALRRVEESGLIARRHGSGSRVIAVSREPRYALTRRTDTDLLRYTEQTTLQLTTSPKTPSEARARKLQLGDPAQWAFVSAVRRVPRGHPIAFAEIYVLEHLVPVLEEITGEVDNAVFTRLLEYGRLELSYVDEVVSATTLPARAARAVDAEPGTGALQIIRRFSSREVGPFEVTLNLHPAGRFEYALRFDRVPDGGH